VLALLGQSVRGSAQERLQLEGFSVYPPQPRLELDLDDGSTCSITDRAPPTLVIYGRQLNSIDQLGQTSQGLKTDLGGGVALMIPLGGTGFKRVCSGLLRLQEARARMALANQMLEAGQISEAEMKAVLVSVRRDLGL
jgi:hypothetical protein